MLKPKYFLTYDTEMKKSLMGSSINLNWLKKELVSLNTQQQQFPKVKWKYRKKNEKKSKNFEDSFKRCNI